MEGRLLLEVVFGSGGIVVVGGSGVIVVGTDWSTMRICLIVRCQKGNFSMSATTVWLVLHCGSSEMLCKWSGGS